jgi:hypothetical protein
MLKLESCTSGRSQQTFIKVTDTLHEVTSHPVNSVLIFLTTNAHFDTGPELCCLVITL